jgi:hypothetical protein
MKSAERIRTRNIDTDGKTHPTSTKGMASPKAIKGGGMKEAQGIIKGDAKKREKESLSAIGNHRLPGD